MTAAPLVPSTKPATIKANPFKQWVRLRLFYRYLKEILKDEKTLDLACGWGVALNINPKFYGFEYDQACYEFLKDEYDVRFGDILGEVPFEKGFFDNVFTQDVLEHFTLPDIERIFRTVNELLKPGGRFINAVPNKRGYQYGLDIQAGHLHYVTTEDITRLADATGFVLERYYAYPLPAFLSEFYTHNKCVYHPRKKLL